MNTGYKLGCFKKKNIVHPRLALFFVLMCLLISCSFSIAEPGPNGIDFWENDRLNLPDYGASRNLILNPSFEAGLRYWGFICYAQGIIPLQYTSFHEVDSTQAHSGSYSLRTRALKMLNPLPLGSLAIPLVPDNNYTLSFYAKGSFATGLSVNLWGRGRTENLFPASVMSFVVNNQWHRFTISFTAQERFSTILFAAQLSSASPETEGSIWLDDIQLEEGGVTAFTPSPVDAQLVSAARGNFLEFGQTPNLNLTIQSIANAAGTVSISVEDFFFKTIFKKNYEFTTDSAGKSSIILTDLSSDIVENNLRGVFIVTGVFDIEGINRTFTDYYRFSVMDFLDNTHKNKDLFNLTYVYQLQSGGPEMARFQERERALGFGSITYDFEKFANDLNLGLDSERMQMLEDYGFTHMGRPVLKLHDGVDGEISENNGALKMTGIKSMINPSSMQLLDFEYICEIKARNRPWNTIWWFTGESNPGCWPLETYPTAFAKFLRATLRGIKRGNPDAKVLIEGGPWNLAPNLGTLWVERYIQDTKQLDPTIEFDGAAAHHYRNFPENPDLDSDIAAFLAMLDRNGYSHWPFYINEGGCYPPFDIPEEGMSPYVWNSANSWYIRPLSYHSGRSERISAAFSARNWLVGLKYQNRVACMEDFMTPSRYTDIDFTSRFYEKIPNTLGRILGNASFDRDIQFEPNCRGYLFKDDATQAPIAVIWSHKESVDRWQEEPTVFKFNFAGQDVKFIDLMENEVTYKRTCDDWTVIPVSPFPLFIKGLPETEDQLRDAIANYQYGAGTSFPVMDQAINNGSFSGASAGFWNSNPSAIPAGWVETAVNMYTTAAGFVQCGSTAEAVNNTGELVKVAHSYTVKADLGGGEGVDATVRVYATQNSNGTGARTLLASVNRPGLSTDGYNLFTVIGTEGSVVPASLAGYYVQVVIGGPYSYANHYLGGYYDNVVATSKSSIEPTCGDSLHPCPIGDINKDCYVDGLDLFEMGDQWLAENCSQSEWCGGADLNHDGEVNLIDLALFADNWMECTDPMQPCCYNP